MSLPKTLARYKKNLALVGVPATIAALVFSLGLPNTIARQTGSTSQQPRASVSSSERTKQNDDRRVIAQHCAIKKQFIPESLENIGDPIQLFDPKDPVFKLTVDQPKPGAIDPITGFPDYEEIRGLTAYTNFSPKETDLAQPGRTVVVVFKKKLEETAN